MEQKDISKKKFNLKSYGMIVAFLCLEMLAFIGFALGNNFILYGLLAIVIAILLFLVTFRQFKKDGFVSYAIFLFPLVVFSILSAISTYPIVSVGAIGLPNAIFIPLTLVFLSLAGFLVSKVHNFETSKMMLVVYGSLAVFVLINLITTMIYYVPFYTLIYKNSFIVYEGKPSPVPIGSMAYMLYGFQFVEVSIYYWRLFPAILSTSVVALFFIDFKNNKKVFAAYATMAFLGIISLIFTVGKVTILTDLFMIVFLAALVISFKVPKSRKIIKYGVFAIGIAFILALILVIINAQSNASFAAGLQNVIASNELLNRLLNTNRFISPINEVLDGLFTGYKILGLGIGSFIVPDSTGMVVGSETICWFVDSFNTSGIFGALFIAVFVVFAGKKIMEYFNSDCDSQLNKILLIGFIIATLGSMFVGYDSSPLIYYNNLNPFYMFPPFLIAIFLISYMFGRVELKTKVQETENKEELKDEQISI